MKTCTACTLKKDLKDFNKSKTTKDGFKYICKICQKTYKSTYDSQNKSKNLEYLRKWIKANPKKVKEYNKKGAPKYWNSDAAKASRARYHKKRYSSDICYRLKCNLRSRLSNAIRRNQKLGSAIKDLGCTIEEFKQYIESKFYNHPVTNESMSWENWGRGSGTWQIDHVIEFQETNLEDIKQVSMLLYYNNMQPLWFEDHLAKTIKNKNIGE